ncbi:unnamed protein product [Meloidogyne enterolobii]|uniref:Uncharacterized protein n=1 Tax=Meloidogyne enterolobii TaxID=390850 RepID=A0ACB1B483_MELEN
MSEGSTNSDFDFVQIVDNNDFNVQTKLDNLLTEFNEEKEKNAKLEEKNNFLEKQMDEVKKGWGYFNFIKSFALRVRPTKVWHCYESGYICVLVHYPTVARVFPSYVP